MSQQAEIRRRTAKARALPEVGEGRVEAYVSVFGVPYNVGFGWKEQIEAGAFDEALAEKNKLPIFWMHSWDEGLLIGDADASTDDKGLKFDGQLYVDDELARRAWRGLSSGAIDEWSVAYMPVAWEIDEDDDRLEHVTKARAVEGSAVVIGANPATETVSVRKRGLVVPVFEETGKVRFVPADELEAAMRAAPEQPAPPAETPAETQGSEPAEVPAERLRLLERPAVRDLYRDQLSSTTVGSPTSAE